MYQGIGDTLCIGCVEVLKGIYDGLESPEVYGQAEVSRRSRSR